MLVGRTLFYNVVEEWRILDAFYLSVTTLNTVALGDLPPLTYMGKVLTVVYIFVGASCRRRLTT
jgi:voltage-gated potassium channel